MYKIISDFFLCELRKPWAPVPLVRDEKRNKLASEKQTFTKGKNSILIKMQPRDTWTIEAKACEVKIKNHKKLTLIIRSTFLTPSLISHLIKKMCKYCQIYVILGKKIINKTSHNKKK